MTRKSLQDIIFYIGSIGIDEDELAVVAVVDFFELELLEMNHIYEKILIIE